MNGRHPIDDLFARGLRDAEATPPPAVWEGIVRERGIIPPLLTLIVLFSNKFY